eukprot:gene1234-1326_t
MLASVVSPESHSGLSTDASICGVLDANGHHLSRFPPKNIPMDVF